jgi:hypothetical protein
MFLKEGRETVTLCRCVCGELMRPASLREFDSKSRCNNRDLCVPKERRKKYPDENGCTV